MASAIKDLLKESLMSQAFYDLGQSFLFPLQREVTLSPFFGITGQGISSPSLFPLLLPFGRFKCHFGLEGRIMRFPHTR
jgi:hypothetical protein